ncbi:MAG: aminoglycoside phosphotransferase family protein [Gammaproteobacteria bacterium]|nr:aminoglycoside phosphotransferase family protein [Gammaproteobacteria bacterium]
MSLQLAESWRTIGDSLSIDNDVGNADAQVWRCVKRHESWGSWRALFSDKPRSLMVPSRGPGVQRSSVKFFISNPLSRLYAQTMLQANRWWPKAQLLPEMTLPPVSGPTLLDELPLPANTQLAFLIGTPGPYQKAAMLIMSDGGTPLALVKIALKESADDMVARETRWLCELGQQERLRGKTPRLLAHGSVRSGRGYLAASVAPGCAVASGFTSAHAAFLTELSRVRVMTGRFADSPACRYLLDSLAQLRSILSESMASLLADSLSDCSQRLAHWHGPFVLAHGDFAPWNVRLHDAGIFVFDWEYAAEGALPLRDVCHFFLAPLAVTGRGISLTQLKTALDRAQALALHAYPEFHWPRPIVAAHCLGYLLHTVLFYGESRGRVLENHPVIKSYCRLMQERAQWIN